MIYSLPYLFITFVLFVLYLTETKKITISFLSRKTAVWIAYIIMWIFVGFRGHIMSDFISYYPYYNHFPDIFHLTKEKLLNGFEPGFNIYTAIIRTFTSNYFAWVAINTLIDFAVFAWFFKRYCKSMILPLIFFVAFNGMLMEFNLYRNMKAIDLFLLSIPYLQNRKWIPYFALNILGFTFHSSSLLYLPMYFILNLKMSKYLLWGGFIIANMIFLSNISIIGLVINNLSFIQNLNAYDKIIGYASRGNEFKFSIGYFERTISFLIFALLYRKLIRENKSNILFFNCYWIYYVSFLVFHEISVFVERVPTLFMFSYWILYPHVLRLKSKFRQPLQIFITLLVVLKIATAFNYKGAGYENVLFDTQSYERRKAITF